ncbi:Glucanase [Balamuthia mandrillaris]
MKQLSAFLLVVSCFLFGGAFFASGQNYPFPQSVEFALEGAITPNHKTAEQLQADLKQEYDAWKSNYLVEMGTTDQGHKRYRVQMDAVDNRKTTSEAQGYGFLIVGLMAGYEPNAREIIDGLYYFFDDHRSSIDERLMDWNVAADEGPDDTGDDSAFDGDLDIAYGLMLADLQWGSDGNVNYREAAIDVIEGLGESCIGPRSMFPLLGDWVMPSQTEQYNENTTRPSDHAYHFFAAFGKYHSEQSSFWNKVKSTIQELDEYLQDTYASETGLLPDFVVYTEQTLQPAPAEFLEAEHDGSYNWNAGRVPWRLGMDALLNGDSVSASQVTKMISWLSEKTGGNPNNIAPGYLLDGTAIPGRDYQSALFVAPFAVAAAAAGEDHQEFLNAIWDKTLELTGGSYFGDSVALLSLLATSGNFWDPTAVEGGSDGDGVDGDGVDGDGSSGDGVDGGDGSGSAALRPYFY